MHLVRDSTGRFHKRPFYGIDELEAICLAALQKFSRRTSRTLSYPLSTDVLTCLIEDHVESLDLYADLSAEGDDIEGVTDFFPSGRPRVRINRILSEDSRRANRLRTTLAHEFCHAHIHGPLFQKARPGFDFFGGATAASDTGVAKACGRETMVDARQVDWMEWQAGYVCGALLMPRVRVREIADVVMRGSSALARIEVGSARAASLIGELMAAFDVSSSAAQVRLAVLGLTSPPKEQPDLFDEF